MKAIKINAEDYLVSVNTLREREQGTLFKRSEFKQWIQEINLPRNAYTLSKFVEFGAVLRLKKGKYRFCKNPIYRDKLQNILVSSIQQNRMKAQKCYNNRYKSDRNILEVDSALEQAAIEFLKKKGYMLITPDKRLLD